MDATPLLERSHAAEGGLGFPSKAANLLDVRFGPWFFLGEIYTDIPLPTDPPQETEHCGSCRACLDVCPTNAFTAPWVLDARKCISYLTIEHDGVIPEALRPAMGNRIYGCDDCQLVCPWNKFAQRTAEPDFAPRHGLDDIDLLDCFGWDESTFLARTEGSAIRRIGYERWRRNVAIALGNAASSDAIKAALTWTMSCAARYKHVQSMRMTSAILSFVLFLEVLGLVDRESRRKKATLLNMTPYAEV
mgnify:CR=1 FL=1